MNHLKSLRAYIDALLETKAGMGTPKYLIANDDIDSTNVKEVAWAFATRNHPGDLPLRDNANVCL